MAIVPDDCINHALAFVKTVPFTTTQKTVAANMTNNTFWTYRPWGWTCASLTPISLVDGQQDYSVADATFSRLVNCWITRTDLTPDDYVPLKVVSHLPPALNNKVGWPNFRVISYEQTISKLRLEKAPEVGTGVTMQIDGDYQKVPTQITNTASATVHPDRYFNQFFNGILYHLYLFSDDNRAGTVVANRHGEKSYSGQLGVWMDSLRMMAEAEDVRDGNDFEFPDETIATVM